MGYRGLETTVAEHICGYDMSSALTLKEQLWQRQVTYLDIVVYKILIGVYGDRNVRATGCQSPDALHACSQICMHQII